MNRSRSNRSLIIPLILAIQFLAGQSIGFCQFSDEKLEFFESNVRPILSDHCSECHGKEATPVQGGFSIASRTTILMGGDTGPGIVPGAPEQSQLIDAINYRGDYEMPPSTKLSDDKIQVLTKWVELGAPWPAHDATSSVAASQFNLQERKSQHWCWQPIRKLEPPEVADTDWALDPIDNFILARLEEAGIRPAVDAERRTWIRRVYLDLIGLPPTPSEVIAFLEDKSVDAHAHVVDRLLASPSFGERWARHWMDLVRYAETYGHEFDYAIEHAYEYRDYLIRAFNADVPFDDFIREHIAGDLIETPRRHPDKQFNESVIATGFWFLGEATHGPVDVKADEAGRIDNQIDVMCKTFLGLTVACARCHDHKFDAISDEDYYALSGFLQSSRRQTALLDPDRKIESARKTVNTQLPKADTAITDWLARIEQIDQRYIRQSLAKAFETEEQDEEIAIDQIGIDWKTIAQSDPVKKETHPLHLLKIAFETQENSDELKERLTPYKKQMNDATSQNEALVSKSELFEDFANGIPDDWFLTGWAFDQPETAFPFAASGNLIANAATATSGRIGGKFYGVLRSPTLELTHDQIFVRARGSATVIRLIIDGYEMDIHNSVLFKGCRFDLSEPGNFVWAKLDGDVKNYRGHKAWLEFIDHGDSFCEIDEIRMANQDCPPPIDAAPKFAQLVLDQEPINADELVSALSRTIKQFLEQPNDFSPSEASEILTQLAGNSNLGKQLIAVRERIDRQLESLPKPKMAVAMTDGTGEDEYLFIRGNSRTLGQSIPRQFLTALSTDESPKQLISHGSGRMKLANQIANPSNPLTSRVIVNRIWHHLMGKGIVESVDNFGLLGKKPSHPQLLDFMATEFCDDDWSFKKIIRRIALSRSYRMGSDVNEKADDTDPENNLFHRSHVKRLEGEAIRDSILAISGSLDPTMFGKSVKVHLTEFMQGRGRPRAGGPLDGNGRRTIYVGVRRNFLAPMMLAFDTPIPFNTIGSRHQSNVPAQALIMMNDPFVVEQAAKWSKLIMQHSKNREDRVDQLYLQAFARSPTEDERDAMNNFLDEQARQRDLDEKQLNDDPETWQDICHVVFNMKEFVFVK